MQSVSSDYFDYYFGWENSRLQGSLMLRYNKREVG